MSGEYRITPSAVKEAVIKVIEQTGKFKVKEKGIVLKKPALKVDITPTGNASIYAELLIKFGESFPALSDELSKKIEHTLEKMFHIRLKKVHLKLSGIIPENSSNR